MKLLEEDEDESMHCGADVEAFQAALNRDIGGDTSTSHPSHIDSGISFASLFNFNIRCWEEDVFPCFYFFISINIVQEKFSGLGKSCLCEGRKCLFIAVLLIVTSFLTLANLV